LEPPYVDVAVDVAMREFAEGLEIGECLEEVHDAQGVGPTQEGPPVEDQGG
jgi:hypothetical protein